MTLIFVFLFFLVISAFLFFLAVACVGSTPLQKSVLFKFFMHYYYDWSVAAAASYQLEAIIIKSERRVEAKESWEARTPVKAPLC